MRYRKRPVEIEAVQFDGSKEHVDSLDHWINGGPYEYTQVAEHPMTRTLYIRTLEGVMEATPGDWIIKGVAGEFYPCKPDIFVLTYEEAD